MNVSDRITVAQPELSMVQLAPSTLLAKSLYQLAPVMEALPVAQTQSGSIFKDRSDTATAWYLPTFVLAPDPDPAFAFSATQATVDAQGNPFNAASLTVGLRKVIPDDAKTYQQQNPSATLREIVLDGLTATLTTTAKDPQTGADVASTYPGVVTIAADGTGTISFGSLLGTAVVIAYLGLTQLGSAKIELAASYGVWRRSYTVPPQPSDGSRMWTMVQANRFELARPVDTFAPSAIRINPEFRRFPPAHPDPSSDDYQQGRSIYALELLIGKKYAAGEYAPGYTVVDASNHGHPILNVNDLKNFDTEQSEFREFTDLGDISQKLPEISKLYVGVLSRVIVAIPASYGIVLGSTGCQAACQAVLDANASQAGACKFQFSFVVGPMVSGMQLLELSRMLSALPSARDCTVTLPSRFAFGSEASLDTPFKTSASFAPGGLPHMVSLAVEIADGPSAASAVASANMFIKQLTATVGPALGGRLGIKLDDFYPQPVDANLSLNFQVTSETDDLSVKIDAASGAVTAVNDSPVDLQIVECGTLSADGFHAQPVHQLLPTHQTLTLPLTASVGQPVVVSRSLQLETPFTKDSLGRYLSFHAVDVASVLYELGVVASGVDFNALGIASIAVGIVLNDVPSISVPAFTLTDLDRSGNTRVQLPVQYAISRLMGTVAFTVTFKDAQRAPVHFTLTNEFVDEPVVVLQSAQIPKS